MKDALLRAATTDFGEAPRRRLDGEEAHVAADHQRFIDTAYEAAMREGALGGKVTGAGGGGYMLFYCAMHRKHRVAEALHRAWRRDHRVFAFDHDGLSRWSPRDELTRGDLVELTADRIREANRSGAPGCSRAS